MFKKGIATLLTASVALIPLASDADAKTVDAHIHNKATSHDRINPQTKKQLDQAQSKSRTQFFLASQANIDFLNNTLLGKGWDFDGVAGWQCFDVVNVYWYHLYGHGLNGAYAKDIPTQNNFAGEATVHPNTPSFKAYPGDVVVFGDKYGKHGAYRDCDER